MDWRCSFQRCRVRYFSFLVRRWRNDRRNSIRRRIPILRRDRRKHWKWCFRRDSAWPSHRTVSDDWPTACKCCRQSSCRISFRDIQPRSLDNIRWTIHRSISLKRRSIDRRRNRSFSLTWCSLCARRWLSFVRHVWRFQMQNERSSMTSLEW